MAILTSLFTGVSGINANGVALSVIGDNIANMNTVGFKASRATFGDILSSSLASGSTAGQIGRGSNLTSVTSTFVQGSMENTTSAFDMAIEGEGFFLMRDTDGSSLYTRAGQFHLDKDGYLVNPGGQFLQGYLFNSAGVSTGAISDINIASLNSAPNPTSNVQITANLDARETPPAAFDVLDPTGTSNFSTSMTVYDSLGNAHQISIYYRLNTVAPAGNQWEWFAVVPASESTSGVDEIQAQGTIDFDNAGAYVSDTPGTISFNFAGGAAQNQTIAFDFATTTQYGSASSTIFQNQDGFSSGAINSVSIDTDGSITAIFTNGQTRQVGQIAVAKFTSPSGLTKLGGNMYAESSASGQPVVGIPNTGGRGKILSNTLELSNVDLAEEFIKMIAAQRGFQANSRVISATDEILQELVNITR